MKKHQKLLLIVALPMALFFFSERFFWFNYNLILRANAIINTYETSPDNRTDNN